MSDLETALRAIDETDCEHRSHIVLPWVTKAADRIAELESALWPLAEIGRYNCSADDDENILAESAKYQGGDPSRTILTMAHARAALEVLCANVKGARDEGVL